MRLVVTKVYHSNRLIHTVEAYDKQINDEFKPVVGFKTKEKFFVIDHILSQKDYPISFLVDKELNLIPISGESQP